MRSAAGPNGWAGMAFDKQVTQRRILTAKSMHAWNSFSKIYPRYPNVNSQCSYHGHDPFTVHNFRATAGTQPNKLSQACCCYSTKQTSTGLLLFCGNFQKFRLLPAPWTAATHPSPEYTTPAPSRRRIEASADPTHPERHAMRVQWTRAITKGSGGNESVRSNEMFALSIIT